LLEVRFGLEIGVVGLVDGVNGLAEEVEKL
jgi:hypothetical protein